MKILFIHQNMPAQYKHLAKVFGSDPNNTVVFLTKPRKGVEIPGVHKVEFKIPRDVTPNVHRYLISIERAIIQGQEVWRMCKKLKEQEGFVPDVICAHPGWGDALFIKDIYPNSPLLSFFEFYYHFKGADVNFDPEAQSNEDEAARIRIKNTVNILSLESADWGISPTFWQQRQHPVEFRQKISVIHDGVDTDLIKPDEQAVMKLPNGMELSQKDEVLTYVSRNFEPYRGFPTFMRSIREILKHRPNCQIVACGGDGVSYGRKPNSNKTWREVLQEEINLTPQEAQRVHWLPWLSYEEYLKILQISSAHIYLTYPFVLSWSMIESMAAGCLLIGSKTPPVEEVIEDGVNGLLTDFFDAGALAERVIFALENKAKLQHIRDNARKTAVDRYAISKLLPLHIDLVKDMAKGEFPPKTASVIHQLNQESGIINRQAQLFGKAA